VISRTVGFCINFLNASSWRHSSEYSCRLSSVFPAWKSILSRAGILNNESQFEPSKNLKSLRICKYCQYSTRHRKFRILKSGDTVTDLVHSALHRLSQQPSAQLFHTHLLSSSVLSFDTTSIIPTTLLSMPSQPPTLPAYGPPLRVLPQASLQQYVNTTEKGKARKPPVQLEDCKLMEMTQYTCDIKGRYSKDAEVWCKPMLRLFRR